MRISDNFSISVGIMAYNEEKNIANVLTSIKAQKLSCCYLKEIIIVASGCSDNTVSIIEDFKKENGLIRNIIQKERKGKASAVNTFFQNAKGDILVIISADIIIKKGCLDNLIKPFGDNKTGMTGARVIPINKQDTFLGYGINLLWAVHHIIAANDPKMGECIALRNLPLYIPEDIITDEAYLEREIKKRNLHLVYVSDSIVINRGPDNIKDFICQRKRIFIGHLKLFKTYGYKVSTCKNLNILSALFKTTGLFGTNIFKGIGIIILEIYSRYAGYIDYLQGRDNLHIWEIAESTKKI